MKRQLQHIIVVVMYYAGSEMNTCIVLLSTGKARMKTIAELDGLLSRFQSLAYYDQYCIASSTMEHILEVGSEAPQLWRWHILFFFVIRGYWINRSK